MWLMCCLILTQPPGWHQYQTNDQKVMLHFPRKPDVNARQQKMAQGETTVTSVGVPRTRPGEPGMIFTWYDLSKPKNEADTPLFLQGLEKGLIQSRQGKSLRSKEHRLRNHIGRECIFEAQGIFYRTQLYVVGFRVLSLTYWRTPKPN